jgi:hypothetical protein
MTTKNDLAAAIAKVATDVAAARAADQAKIADLEAQLAGSASGATDAELASMLDAVNAIETSIAAPAASLPSQITTLGAAVLTADGTPRSALPQSAAAPSAPQATQFPSGGSVYPAPVAVVDRSALPFDPNAGA